MSSDQDILLPDQPAPDSEVAAKPSGGGKKRSWRILKILTAGFLVMIILVMYIFSGDDTPVAPSQNTKVAFEDAGTGQFVDSRIQDAFERQRAEEERKKLIDQVKAGESLAAFQDAPPPPPGSAADQAGTEKLENLFGDIDRQAAEREAAAKRQAAEQARQQRQNAAGGILSSRMPVPSEAGRTPPASRTPVAPEVSPPKIDPAVKQAQAEASMKMQGFSRLSQQLQGGDASSAIPAAVYHTSRATVSTEIFSTDATGESQAKTASPIRSTGFTFFDEDSIKAEDESRVITLQQAGDLTTAWLEGRVDSDVPSAMVVTEILEGPMKGAKLLGTHGMEGECILIDFHTVQWRGREIEVQAAAADIKTGQTCISGRVNYRAFQRYGVPILFSVARVGASYQRQKDSQTVTSGGWDGIERTETIEGGRSFSSIAKEEAIDGALDAFSDPVTRYANMPIQITKDQGVIGIRWLGRVEVDLAVDR